MREPRRGRREGQEEGWEGAGVSGRDAGRFGGVAGRSLEIQKHMVATEGRRKMEG